MACYQGNCTLGKKETIRLLGLLDTGSELALIPGDKNVTVIHHQSGQVIDGVLAQIPLTVSPQSCPAVISPVLEGIIGRDILGNWQNHHT